MEDLTWVYKSRIKYWEETTAHRRYAALRRIKNSFGDFAGKYALKEIAARVTIADAKKIGQFETGDPEGAEKILPALVADLGLTMDQFNYQGRLKPELVKAPTPVAPTPPAPPAPTTTPTPEVKKRATKVVPGMVVETVPVKTPVKPAPGMITSVKNHTLDTFIILVKDGVLHILEDSPASLKVCNAVWIAPADDVGGGTKLVPRDTVLIK